MPIPLLCDRLRRQCEKSNRCRGLVPWSLTFVATNQEGLWHPGELRSFLCSGERETPRREAVASVFSWHTTCRVNHQQAWGGITYPERGVPPRHNVPALPFVTNPLSCGPAKYNERTEN